MRTAYWERDVRGRPPEPPTWLVGEKQLWNWIWQIRRTIVGDVDAEESHAEGARRAHHRGQVSNQVEVWRGGGRGHLLLLRARDRGVDVADRPRQRHVERLSGAGHDCVFLVLWEAWAGLGKVAKRGWFSGARFERLRVFDRRVVKGGESSRA